MRGSEDEALWQKYLQIEVLKIITNHSQMAKMHELANVRKNQADIGSLLQELIERSADIGQAALIRMIDKKELSEILETVISDESEALMDIYAILMQAALLGSDDFLDLMKNIYIEGVKAGYEYSDNLILKSQLFGGKMDQDLDDEFQVVINKIPLENLILI